VECVSITISSRENWASGFVVCFYPSPGVLPESIFQRRIGDGSSVVRNRRSCHNGDNFQNLFLRESGSDERIEFLIAQVPALLNERSCQGRKCSKSLVRGQAPHTNRSGLFSTDPLLERQGCMERDGIVGGIRDCICQENDLDLRLREAAAVDLLKHPSEGVDELR
jgi:hypothetical protein